MPAHRLDMRLIKEVLRLKFAASLCAIGRLPPRCESASALFPIIWRLSSAAD